MKVASLDIAELCQIFLKFHVLVKGLLDKYTRNVSDLALEDNIPRECKDKITFHH